MTDTEDASKSNEQTINQIAAVIKLDISSKSAQENENSTKRSDTIIEAANKPPKKTRICYSVNQIEGLQMLGNYTFVAQYETNEFIQKIVGLLKKPDTTKISRLPTPWREKMFELGCERLLIQGRTPRLSKSTTTSIYKVTRPWTPWTGYNAGNCLYCLVAKIP